MILRKLNILFVDDQVDYVEPIAAFLNEKYQHVTTTVQTAERAQKELGKTTYDIIFLDYRLPGLSGMDLLRWAGEQKLDTPIVMVTGQGDEDVAVEAMKLGAYDYLNKTGIKLDYLPVVINKAIETYVLRKAQEELQQEKLTREKNMLAIKVFQETTKTFINRINNDLANILLRVKMYEKQKAVKKSAEAAERDVKHMLGEIEFSGKAIEATISALVSLNQSVTKLHDVQKKAVDLQAELEKTLKQMEEKAQKKRS